MRTLVIGYGSIGERHVHVLRQMGKEVAVLSSREISFAPCFKSLQQAILEFDPEYTVIANRTSEHDSTLRQLIGSGFKGFVLVEKPLFESFKPIPDHSLKGIFIGYNLRFHPLLQKLKKLIESENVISVHVYVGKYLPTWRTGISYQLSYSAQKKYGGGVLRDLSHELDYLNWIFKGWKSLTAIGGHWSHLEIETDDVFGILMTTAKCQLVYVQMNYLDRVVRREVIVVTDGHSYRLDLVNHVLQIDEQAEGIVTERNDTYRMEHEAVFNGSHEPLCTAEEGMEVNRMIDAAELAADKKIWVHR